MLKLHARLGAQWDNDPFIVRVATSTDGDVAERQHEALLIDGIHPSIGDGFKAYLTFASIVSSQTPPVIQLPHVMNYLKSGDILRVIPRTGEVVTLYRRMSSSNSIFMTERCNSNCLMCSQPPKDIDDSFLVRTFLEAIPLMHPETAELGITGGEPTLLGDRFFEVVESCKKHLPKTALHILSNGRLFNYLTFSQRLAEIAHPDLMIGIPLYSDIAGLHDFVVQAKGAFDQTIRGIMNLKRCGVKVELRVVLHAHTIDRLPDLARFIARNLPNVDHVALMGLEIMGYVKMNLADLWIEPAEYQANLVKAVRELVAARMSVSIYNHQLCVLDRELWPFARRSISDWKNEYLDACADCAVRDCCGGFFFSSKLKYSDHIRPIPQSEMQCSVSYG
jgi:His-Xaa-Ser system radical SAM maturase HxsC